MVRHGALLMTETTDLTSEREPHALTAKLSCVIKI